MWVTPKGRVNMVKIQFDKVSKVFGSRPEQALQLADAGVDRAEIQRRTGQVLALHNVSFSVEEGEIVVVMGLSGSGKSTLVRCLNHLIPPSSGKVLIDGVHVGGLNKAALRHLRQKKMGMVFQNFALFPHKTVLQNAEFGLEVMGESKTRRREVAMEMLTRVGLASWENARPDELSGGMRQRVGLARALALNPDILLMDEAFSALDPLIRRDMQEELLRLQEDLHKTVLFISHDLDEALKIGNRIVLLRDGCMIQDGTPEEILTSPADDYVARFVEGADLTRVLTASSVMRPPGAVTVLGVDGPRTALRKMKTQGITSLFVLERITHKLLGLVLADDALALAQDGKRDLEAIVMKDIVSVAEDTAVTELIPLMADLPYPLAVVDSKGRLSGVIVRGALLGALGETKGGNA